MLCFEISQSKCQTIILSSEDFEFLHLKTDKLHFIKKKFNELGCGVEIILCFREQVSYADSLYCELLKYGLDISFDGYINEIIENGGFNFNKKQIYSFKYDEIARGFKEVFGADGVHSLSYDKSIEHSFFDAADIAYVLSLKNLQPVPTVRSLRNMSMTALAAITLAKFNKFAALKKISESRKKIGRNHIIGNKLNFTDSEGAFISEYTFFEDALKKKFTETFQKHALYFNLAKKEKPHISKMMDNHKYRENVDYLVEKAMFISSINPMFSKILRKIYKTIYN